ncbi:hypothetical protein HZU73_09549 [Apis mellifera caucasica]|uniref:Uncharacterized protein LOC726155 n=1 Tax=Apis mellifera TaxID=7460 RepID=A0A7M7FZW0_APIME|nr:uncharacterized protein LOC726155 [Apis mellifera]KAG6795099.1 hypothetical protein HZU73_09549 [Apis mellifera caucasica]KAG9428178.1 hypothetical protein HZU67_09580 [Apis mellifera carnica]|eukprot:XP_001121915.3 uncharacterized protein LOC726155 [Apis mellifera]
MHLKYVIVIVCFFFVARANSQLFVMKNLEKYSRIFNLGGLWVNKTGNELWDGLIRDCDRSITFSCIQKNAYAYLDHVFEERDNITVFDGFTMTKNKLDYSTCRRNLKENYQDSMDENLVDGSIKDDCNEEESEEERDRQFDEKQSPLEEVTDALRKRTVKFLATRDYEVQLPDFFFEGATIKLSPREVDENGALVRVDFGQSGVENQGRLFFKKIRKFIQNKLLTSFLALLLIIKLIKLKFMFVIPFLFGVGTAKKLFLKLLLFFIPAFAHVFKLCSSYYSTHGTKYHHHHHQIAHHHHHVPVPVPVPTYYSHHHHNEFDGYDYAHPHIQYRKDMEELKEWGIEPYEEPYEIQAESIGGGGTGPVHPPGVLPASFSAPTYSGTYSVSQYASNVQPLTSPYLEKHPQVSAHNLAYSAYADNNRRTNSAPVVNVPLNPANLPTTLLPTATNVKAYTSFGQMQNVNSRQGSTKSNQIESKITVGTRRSDYDDEFYGPIIKRLEDIFKQLRFVDEPCRERLVCSMYKNPTVYSPHSNLVSNELSRDPQELKQTGIESLSSQKFHRYLEAARLGQDGGDCLRTYPCHINTE